MSIRHIKIKILEADGLDALNRDHKTSDPYVRVSLGDSGSHAQTRYVTASLAPVWNATLEFSKVYIHETPHSSRVTLEVWNHNWKLFPDKKMGWLEFAIDSAWQDGEEHEFSAPLREGHGEIHYAVSVFRMHNHDAESKLRGILKAKFKKHGSKWVDPEFPHSPKSLTFAGTDAKGVIAWKRPKDINPEAVLIRDKGIKAGDVVQGALGDCWLISAMGMLATQPKLLRDVIVKWKPEEGYASFRLFKNGEECFVTVDDAIPVNAADIPVFGSCADGKGEFWVPLVEKAFAKLYRSNYEALEAGSTAEGLMDLTGEGADSFRMDDPRYLKLKEEGKVDKMLKKWSKQRFLMGCSKSGETEKDAGMGILSGHAYAVVDVKHVTTEHHYFHKSKKAILMKIRNPWGSDGEWTGAFGDGSKEWTPALRKELKHTDANDGIFWMSFEDWGNHFDRFDLVRLYSHRFSILDKKWHARIFHAWWDEHTDGGCMNYESWIKNTQYALTLPKDSDCFIFLSQQDRRYKWQPSYEHSIGCYLLKVEDNSKKLESQALIQQRQYPPWNAETLFINKRDNGQRVELSAGTYIIIPATFEPGIHMDYSLGVYSEQKMQLKEIKGKYDMKKTGSWTAITAGGPPSSPSFYKNPCFVFRYKNVFRLDETYALRIIVTTSDGTPVGFQVRKDIKLHQDPEKKNGATHHDEPPAKGRAEAIVTCERGSRAAFWSEKIYAVVVYSSEADQLGKFAIQVECTQPGMSIEGYY